MGLDSVELLIRIEKYFDIAIPDQEAGKIVTVQDFVDCVYKKVSLHPTGKCKSQILFYKLRNYFIVNHQRRKNEITPDLKIRDLVTADLAKTWADLEQYLRIELPTLSELDLNPEQEKDVKIFGLTWRTKPAPVAAGTVGQLVDWSLAMNHETLIDPQRLFDKDDIERIIIGIISDSVGTPVNEIKLEHQICYDLGID
jgi:hypothetical protein